MNTLFEMNFDWKQYFVVSENVIRQKEHSEIEFKENFHSPKGNDKKLHKWIASFANANGGLIIYGVKNNGELAGLKNKSLHDFDNKDLSQELLDYFAPEIKFELFIKEVEGFELGFLYIYKSTDKPVIVIKSANNTIQESDIFYRYPGQSRKIAYGDLKNIIENKYQTLNNKWIELMNSVATIGVENVGLLNVVNGELIGSNNKLLIPKELLSKIKFINEGTFVEKDGAPTLKLIGDVQPVDSTKIIQLVETKYQMITHFELYKSFFERKIDKDTAKEFFRKVIYENTQYYPIYFYLITSELSAIEVQHIIETETGQSKEKVRKRLVDENNNYVRFKHGKLDTETDAATKILSYFTAIQQQEPINSNPAEELELRYLLQAITHLAEEEFDIAYVLSLLREIYDNNFNKSSIAKTFIRKAICHIDLIIFGKQYFTKNTIQRNEN